MKRNMILFVILLISFLFIKRGKYVELNNLKIIDRITIECNNVVLREVLPVRDDNGIEYEYKYYKKKNLNKLNSKYYIDKAEIINKCKKRTK